MLLRRVIEHVKAQNWTAVVLDFVIVVVGVFMGIQVSNWNQQRIDREREEELLVRLHGETLELTQQRKEVAALPRRRKEVLKTVQLSLLDSGPPRLFNGEECMAIQFSHILRRPPDTLPTLEEMVSSGRIGLISDAAIRRQLTRYLQVRERSRYVYDELVADVFRLAHLYPQHFGRDLVLPDQVSVDGFNRFKNDPLSDEMTVLNKCHSDGMKNDPAFLSDIEDNYARINAYMSGVIVALDVEVQKMEKALLATGNYTSSDGAE